MRALKFTGIFAAGLCCGLFFRWMPSSTANGSNRGGVAGGPKCVADIAPAPDGNGIVDVDDLLVVINAWGECPEPPPPTCDPTGMWNNAVSPSYACAFGLVNFNIATWTFMQTGTMLTVTASTPSGPIAMTGPVASCESGGAFTVSKVVPGGCSITYALAGTFSSPTQFTGTFTVSFTGSNCQNCASQSFNVSAAKQ